MTADDSSGEERFHPMPHKSKKINYSQIIDKKQAWIETASKTFGLHALSYFPMANLVSQRGENLMLKTQGTCVLVSKHT